MKKHYYDEERKNERVKKGNKNWNSLYEKSNSVYVVMNRRSSTMFVQQQRNLIPLPLPRKAPPALARPLLFGALPLAHSPSLGAGTKIEFLTDQGETLRNEYLLCKNFKTGFGFFVPWTVFSSHSGPASL